LLCPARDDHVCPTDAAYQPSAEKVGSALFRPVQSTHWAAGETG
jgi:hypothetical protein